MFCLTYTYLCMCVHEIHFGVTSYLLNTAKPTHLSPFELYCKEFFNIFFKNLLFLATHSVCAHMHISKCVCMTHKHKCLCIFAFVYFNSRAELCFQAPERSKSVCKWVDRRTDHSAISVQLEREEEQCVLMSLCTHVHTYTNILKYRSFFKRAEISLAFARFWLGWKFLQSTMEITVKSGRAVVVSGRK